MTTQALDAWTTVRTQLDSMLDSLTDQEWQEPSACPGWRVRDLLAHLGASARAAIDPLPDPPDAPALPDNRERQHDVFVDRRRDWSVDEVVKEYREYGSKLVELVTTLQAEPAASQPFPVPGLGVYPAHSLANAMVFDYYCHLRHDLLAPHGPIERALPAPEHATVHAAVTWMMLGLPQMQGDALDDTITAPITLHLTGPGQSEWTIHRPDPAGGLVVDERGGADVVVTSDAHAFVAWATQRHPWQQDCSIIGDPSVATPLLDALNII